MHLADIFRGGYYPNVAGIAEQNQAHRRFGAVYFTRLSLAEVRCFGPEQYLNLTDGNRPAKWTVVLGENGVGKTTLLQCLWAMAPQPYPDNSVSAPRGMDARSLSLERGSATISRAILTATIVLDEPLTSNKTGAQEQAKFLPLPPGSHSGGPAILYSRPANAVCCGYGALRRSADLAVEATNSGHSAASLFSDDASLISGSEWLLRADYAASSTTDNRAAIRRDKIRTALIGLLPDVSDIRVAGLDEETPRPRIDVQTHYGWVPMRALSLGYRSMIAWVIDLASRMFEAYPDSADPLTEPAIALVDEIDLHLHPRWQREITAHLDRLFPNVQFIVTAHSPLVVQGAGVTNVAVLRRSGDHVEILNDPEEVRGWRVDQILTSDLFGLRSARPVEVEQLLERQQALVLLDTPTDAQRAELAAIDARLAGLSEGEAAQERKTWETARRLADRLASEPGR
ncbi:MAG TPA: AAA family ATPase [Kofleriaceae bacterium]|nr:AAA family ATPase [Kofleriaceae bacterium]